MSAQKVVPIIELDKNGHNKITVGNLTYIYLSQSLLQSGITKEYYRCEKCKARLQLFIADEYILLTTEHDNLVCVAEMKKLGLSLKGNNKLDIVLDQPFVSDCPAELSTFDEYDATFVMGGNFTMCDSSDDSLDISSIVHSSSAPVLSQSGPSRQVKPPTNDGRIKKVEFDLSDSGVDDSMGLMGEKTFVDLAPDSPGPVEKSFVSRYRRKY